MAWDAPDETAWRTRPVASMGDRSGIPARGTPRTLGNAGVGPQAASIVGPWCSSGRLATAPSYPRWPDTLATLSLGTQSEWGAALLACEWSVKRGKDDRLFTPSSPPRFILVLPPPNSTKAKTKHGVDLGPLQAETTPSYLIPPAAALPPVFLFLYSTLLSSFSYRVLRRCELSRLLISAAIVADRVFPPASFLCFTSIRSSCCATADEATRLRRLLCRLLTRCSLLPLKHP